MVLGAPKSQGDPITDFQYGYWSATKSLLSLLKALFINIGARPKTRSLKAVIVTAFYPDEDKKYSSSASVHTWPKSQKLNLSYSLFTKKGVFTLLTKSWLVKGCWKDGHFKRWPFPGLFSHRLNELAKSVPLAINWLLLELKRRLVEKVVGLLREQEMRDRECEWDQKSCSRSCSRVKSAGKYLFKVVSFEVWPRTDILLLNK